jgi:hypothetical protein
LHIVKEERNILHTIKRGETNWFGDILHRNCISKHIIEGKIKGGVEVMGRQGRRHKQLINDIKETRVYGKLRGSARSDSVENSLYKRLWTCKRDYGLNDECQVM